jgi:tannase/feruloyl esterase
MFKLVLGIPALAAGLLYQPTIAQTNEAASCDRLAHLTLPATKIIEARIVAAGSFTGPPAPFSGRDVSALYRSLPTFCRVFTSATPTSDSDIRIEVWMPIDGWNGKLQALGNGGFAGLIDYPNLGMAITKGYAATATDAGHTGSPIEAAWALGHPEKVVDFGHRGIHEMTRVAKDAVRAFYGYAPRRSFFAGCSDGGREALMEAQRYPGDYDGILAGAPAYAWTKLLTTAVWHTRALTQDAASFITPDKIPVIGSAVNAACDAQDGVTDGILADPRRCRFDPSTIECKPGNGSNACLTAQQAAALRKIYEGPRDASGRQVFPGYLPGAEEGGGGWTTWITGPAPKKSLMAAFGFGYFSQMVYGRPDWNSDGFELESDLRAAVEKTAQALDATDANLDPFRARGGKLILYHGWEDPAIPATSTINYYDEVVSRVGRRNADVFVRLYLAPGVQHCAGGPGPDAFGQMDEWSSDEPTHTLRVALEQWVEKGAAPSRVIASKFAGEGPARKTTMTRPLCPYPLEARYVGKADANDAASFACARPPR